MNHEIESRIKEKIREVPEFPKPGILFYDITTVLQNGPLFRELIQVLVSRYQHQKIDAFIGIESRGFIFASPLAAALGAAFIPVRKPGKLPYSVESASYLTEYSTDTLEIHKDALSHSHRVVVVDDLIATGGTAKATADLAAKLGATVVECAFIIELQALGGRKVLNPYNVVSLVKY